MKNIYLQIPLIKQEISDLVLATVTRTEGSTPQKPGSSALFSRAGLIAGTIGGGVLEEKVQKIAIESLLLRNAVHPYFRLQNNVSGGEDALCGGKISILIDPCLEKHLNVFEALRKASEARIPGVLITVVTDMKDDKVLINRYWATDSDRDFIPQDLRSFIEPQIGILISASDSYDFREIKLPDQKNIPSTLIFLEPLIPEPQLIIAGAGHIGKALLKIGKMLNFDITVIDDRPEFANSENLPEANTIMTGDIGETIKQVKKGNDTYIVIVTRGHRDDGNALKACIGSEAAYIGMIGSKNKVALMHKEFIRNGWATEEQWSKVFAPIGLDIGSKTVEEIAVSIAAQLVQIKYIKNSNKIVQ